LQTRLSYSVQGTLLTFWLEGDYTVEAYAEMVAKAFDDPTTPPTVRLLLDGSCSEVDRNPDDIRRLLPAFTTRAHRIHRIAAITRTDVHYGMVRMSAALLARYGIDVHPFRQRSDALAWVMSDARQEPSTDAVSPGGKAR
jgi:hypothetical protein